MNTFVQLAMYLLWLRSHHCAPAPDEEVIQRGRLKSLSKAGEEFVDEEVKKALTGVKQMKDIMEINEEKHKDLMKSLKRSSEEKQEALHLMEEIKVRLSDAESQCQMTLTSEWEGCKPCLETSCLIFYVTKCHHGISTFTSKVAAFLRGLSSVSFTPRDGSEQDMWFNEQPEGEDSQLMDMEHSFSQLRSDVGAMFAHSIAFFKNMQWDFDQPFHEYFMSDPDLTESKAMPLITEDAIREDGFLQGWDLPDFLQTLLDFSSDIFERTRSVCSKILDRFQAATKDLLEQVKGSESTFTRIMPEHEIALCKELDPNTSGCLQFQEICQRCQDIILKDCPDVPVLQVKSDEAFQLINRSRQQYQQIVHIIERHAQDTSNVIYNMKERFGWVTELANFTTGSGNIFNIIKVFSGHEEGDFAKLNETVVELNILASPTFIVRVPPDLETESPEFIEHVAAQALQLYRKNMQEHQ